MSTDPQPLLHKIILVVDDEADLREIVIEELQSAGASVHGASNGLEALAILQQRSVDVIVSDVNMPKMDGLEFLQQLRQQKLSQPIIILVTGCLDLDLATAQKMGANEVHFKPFKISALITAITAQLAKKHTSRRRFARYSSDLQISITCGEAAAYTTKVINIGQGGLHVKASTSVPKPGEILYFHIPQSQPDQPELSGYAICRWAQDTEFGLEFTAPNTDDKQKILQWITK